MYKIALLCGLIPFSINATDLGRYGHVFPVMENNLIEILEDQFAKKNPVLDEKLGEVSGSVVKKHMHRPNPVYGLKRATESRNWKYDPTFTTSESIFNVDGKVLVAKGEKFNPLENGSIVGSLLFFDGDDEDQVAWAKEQEEDGRWVLTNGDPLELSEQEEREVYFDQFGSITWRFGIKSLPAKVSQEGCYLVVEEIFLKGGI